MKKIFIFTITSALSLLILLYLFSGFFRPPFDWNGDSYLAPGFTWEGFAQIKMGMSKSEVDQLIGTYPFHSRILEWNGVACYTYTRGGKLRPFRFSDSTAEICFDDDIVVGIHEL